MTENKDHFADVSKTMICPFCGVELDVYGSYAICNNPECWQTMSKMSIGLWRALIDGKAAQDALKKIREHTFLYHPALDYQIPWEKYYNELKEIASITKQEVK